MKTTKDHIKVLIRQTMRNSKIISDEYRVSVVGDIVYLQSKEPGDDYEIKVKKIKGNNSTSYW